MSDWIRVKDTPPFHTEPIVYARPKGDGRWSVGIAYWTVSKRWNPEMGGESYPKGFTYYKYLGEPPKEAG